LANSVDIARRCAVRPLMRAPILPRFTTAEGRDEPEELASQARQGLEARLAKFKLPKRVLFVNELPRNAMGKVQKAELRKTYGDLYKK
jgi:acyl-coenzyme A synthetase/AMP-(fatty) acid ligase